MRQTVSLNRKWAFVMDAKKPPENMPSPAYYVNLPHTWNAIDGQDGGGDYFRGACAYVKTLSYEELPEGEKLFIEIQGANSSADLYVGGRHIAMHIICRNICLTQIIRQNGGCFRGARHDQNGVILMQVGGQVFEQHFQLAAPT